MKKQISPNIRSGALGFFHNFFSWLRPTTTGEIVEPEDALTIDSAFTCTRVLAESVASLPCVLMDVNGDRRDPATGEKLFKLLRYQPNEETTAYLFRIALMVDTIVHGNGYAQIRRNAKGEIYDIWQLDATTVNPKRSESGKLEYEVARPDGGSRTLKPEEVLHLRGFVKGGLVGIAFSALQREAFAGAKAGNAFSNEFYGNGMAPSGSIEIAEQLSEESFQRLQDQIVGLFSGHGNHHKIPILEGGAKFVPQKVDAASAQMLEGRKFNRTIMAGLFRVPAHMINDMEKATFSNIEHQDLSFTKHTLRPWLENIQQELRMKLFPDRNDLEVVFDTSEMLRGDFKATAEAFATLVNSGIEVANGARRKMNWNPYEGVGESPVVNGTMKSLEAAEKDIATELETPKQEKTEDEPEEN